MRQVFPVFPAKGSMKHISYLHYNSLVEVIHILSINNQTEQKQLIEGSLVFCLQSSSVDQLEG